MLIGNTPPLLLTIYVVISHVGIAAVGDDIHIWTAIRDGLFICPFAPRPGTFIKPRE